MGDWNTPYNHYMVAPIREPSNVAKFETWQNKDKYIQPLKHTNNYVTGNTQFFKVIWKKIET